MFRTVFPSINRSSSLYIQQYLFDKCQLLYVQSWTPDDGRKDRPKHVECHSKIKQIWYIDASSWFYYRNNITMHGPVNVKYISLNNVHPYIFRRSYDVIIRDFFLQFHIIIIIIIILIILYKCNFNSRNFKNFCNLARRKCKKKKKIPGDDI